MDPQNDKKTLRDEFAMAALTGLLSNSDLVASLSREAGDQARGETDEARAKLFQVLLADAVHEIADAMLAQRLK